MQASVWAIAAAAAACGFGGPAAAEAPSGCKMMQVGVLPVEFAHNRPTAPARVGDAPAKVLVDTGAAQTVLFRSAAAALKLKVSDLDAVAYGAGGTSSVGFVQVPSLEIAGMKVKGFNVLVVGDKSHKSDTDLLLGYDVLGKVDLDVDLKNRTVRLLQPKGCSDEDMPYWVKGAYSQLPLLPAEGEHARPIVTVQVNGRPVRAMLDTGASRSVLSPTAAARAGVPLSRAPDESMQGVGGTIDTVSTGLIDKLQIGDEAVTRTPLLVSDLYRKTSSDEFGSRIAKKPEDLTEMVLGADFFASHRVLISPSHHAVYFTYEGGPVFQKAPPAPPAS